MTQPPADPRLARLTAWLATFADRYALELASLAPASADASFRRYFRVASAAAPTIRSRGTSAARCSG